MPVAPSPSRFCPKAFSSRSARPDGRPPPFCSPRVTDSTRAGHTRPLQVWTSISEREGTMRFARIACASLLVGLVVTASAASAQDTPQALRQDIDRLRRDFEALKQDYRSE